MNIHIYVAWPSELTHLFDLSLLLTARMTTISRAAITMPTTTMATIAQTQPPTAMPVPGGCVPGGTVDAIPESCTKGKFMT